MHQRGCEGSARERMAVCTPPAVGGEKRFEQSSGAVEDAQDIGPSSYSGHPPRASLKSMTAVIRQGLPPPRTCPGADRRAAAPRRGRVRVQPAVDERGRLLRPGVRYPAEAGIRCRGRQRVPASEPLPKVLTLPEDEIGVGAFALEHLRRDAPFCEATAVTCAVIDLVPLRTRILASFLLGKAPVRRCAELSSDLSNATTASGQIPNEITR